MALSLLSVFFVDKSDTFVLIWVGYCENSAGQEDQSSDRWSEPSVSQGHQPRHFRSAVLKALERTKPQGLPSGNDDDSGRLKWVAIHLKQGFVFHEPMSLQNFAPVPYLFLCSLHH